MGKRRGAARRAVCGRDVAIKFVDAALAQPRLHELQAAGYAGQEVVEVVRQPAGELADCLHLLALAQRLLGCHELTRAFFDAALQLRGKVPQRPLAFAYFLEAAAGVVLAAARTQRRSREADERRRMERPLEEGDVAEHLEETPRRGIALQPAAALGQQDERKVRPFRLVLQTRPTRP